MLIHLFTNYEKLRSAGIFSDFQAFLLNHPQGSFFQSPEFFQLADGIQELKPFLWIGTREDGAVVASLLGVVQTNGRGLKSWFSRRLIVWGGPLVAAASREGLTGTAFQLLEEIKNFAHSRTIYIEFRNLFDTSALQRTFEDSGFEFQPYLNFLVKTDDESSVKKRMSSNRRRQIKNSLQSGAEIVEADSREEVMAFYQILNQLYKEKVKKPLPGPDFFMKFWELAAGKFFLVKYEGEVVGGSICPIFNNKVIYDWYRCGKLDVAKGLHVGVLAAWASIQYALDNDFGFMDFMGAGRPEEEYGVRTFKEPFGGEKVAFGRYQMIVNRPLYELGKVGLKTYQKIQSIL